MKFNALMQTRNNILKLVNALDLEQINKIPEGFNNNIAWNFGHVIAQTQLLTYSNSKQKCRVENYLIEKYRKGSKPGGDIDPEEWSYLLDLMNKTTDWLIEDYNSELFADYQSYSTSFGLELDTIEDVFNFIPIHEGLHLGYMMAMKRLVSSK